MDLIKRWKTGIFIAATTILHILIAGNLNLTDDEAYYWVWSRYLDLSYYDHPPLIAYLIRFFTEIFGDNNLSVRLTAVLAITVSSIFIYKIVKCLYQDERLSFLAVVIFNIMPIFAILSFMSLPDLPLIVFYTMGLYYFIRLVYEKKAKLWYLLAVIIGLGLLSKYNMFLIYPGVFFYLLFNREQRFWLKRKEPYLAFLISLLFFLPVIIWNVQNDWASFSFHLYQRHHKGLEIRLDYFTLFWVTQLLVASPILLVGMFKTLIKNFKNKDVQLLFFYGAPIFIIFLLISFFTDFKLHWTALTYIPFLIIMVRYTNWNKFWKYGGLGLAIFLSLFLYTQSFYPVAKINPQDDISSDMHGWDQVGKEVQFIYNSQDQGDWFLFSHRYQLTSQLSFYLPEKDYVYSINNSKEQFDFWQETQDLVGKNGIFVTHSFYQVNPDDLYLFDRVELFTTIDIYRANRVYRTFYIYKCYNFGGVR